MTDNIDHTKLEDRVEEEIKNIWRILEGSKEFSRDNPRDRKAVENLACRFATRHR